ncbi:MAG TPA: GtrA family protein [Anaerolineae bacterium]|nr:GtrA family protein [Anaerolineae bacterium]
MISKLLNRARGNNKLTKLLDPAKAKEVERFCKFFVVGASGTLIDFGTLNLLILAFGFNKALANTCSFTAALVNNFTWNRLWTFPESRNRPIAPQFVQYLLVSIGGLLLNQAIFLGLDAYVLGEAGLLAMLVAPLAGALGMPHYTLAYNMSKAVATVIVLFWNFGANRIWTFGGI